jgi:hypothetical protein
MSCQRGSFDPHATDDCQKREVGAIEQGSELVANDVEEVAFRKVL